ncbi:hypothetical protein AAMO2058_000393500 [Amorphochlora amoebiformis]
MRERRRFRGGGWFGVIMWAVMGGGGGGGGEGLKFVLEGGQAFTRELAPKITHTFGGAQVNEESDDQAAKLAKYRKIMRDSVNALRENRQEYFSEYGRLVGELDIQKAAMDRRLAKKQEKWIAKAKETSKLDDKKRVEYINSVIDTYEKDMSELAEGLPDIQQFQHEDSISDIISDESPPPPKPGDPDPIPIIEEIEKHRSGDTDEQMLRNPKMKYPKTPEFSDTYSLGEEEGGDQSAGEMDDIDMHEPELADKINFVKKINSAAPPLPRRPSSPARNQETFKSGFYKIAKKLNLREGAAIASQKLATIRKGTIVRVCEILSIHAGAGGKPLIVTRARIDHPLHGWLSLQSADGSHAATLSPPPPNFIDDEADMGITPDMQNITSLDPKEKLRLEISRMTLKLKSLEDEERTKRKLERQRYPFCAGQKILFRPQGPSDESSDPDNPEAWIAAKVAQVKENGQKFDVVQEG